MRILFLSRWYPYPPTNGSKLRVLGILDCLCREHQVDLISFTESGEDVSQPPQGGCPKVQIVRRKPFDPGSTRARLGYFRALPRSVVATYSEEMVSRVRDALARNRYDVIVASQIDMVPYARNQASVPAILEEVESSVFFEQYADAGSSLSRLRYGLTWLKHRNYVRRALDDFQACTVASTQERELLSSFAGESIDIEVIPNGIDLDACGQIRVEKAPDTLIFTGSLTFTPNYDAMFWFVGEVFPQILAEVPGAGLIITGDHGKKSLSGTAGVTLTGMVDDVRPLIASATVSIAPIFTGGGSRLKILEAMALRTPVVATSKGAEGIEAEDGRHLLVADEAGEFADAVVSLLRDEERRRALADNAFELVRCKYDSSLVYERLADLVERVGSDRVG